MAQRDTAPSPPPPPPSYHVAIAFSRSLVSLPLSLQLLHFATRARKKLLNYTLHQFHFTTLEPFSFGFLFGFPSLHQVIKCFSSTDLGSTRKGWGVDRRRRSYTTRLRRRNCVPPFSRTGSDRLSAYSRQWAWTSQRSGSS